jgi:nucleotide-binding universal stress UspA family protein
LIFVLKTILVALDSSELSQRVIQSLDELQLYPATKIILAQVMPAPESNMETAVDRPQASEEVIYRHIEKQLQAYQASLPCESELEIVTGDPAVEIVRLAHIYQANLIVIGTRGLTGLERILQGSVSSQVVADAPCSVLVVKPE